MDISQWLIFLLIVQIIHGLGTWKLYIKAKRQAWEAFIPIYNAIILMKIINRSSWWVILLFVPIVNLIMFPVVWVETARSFGKNTYTDTFLAVVTLGFYNYYLNYVANVGYVENRSLHPKSSSGDWVSSILFAIVAATIVHTYFIQPFTIPSSSLEKSLLVGDFLFVSKFHYGARTPMTTVAAPMVHDTIPILKTKSYLFDDHKGSHSWKNKLQLPYFRIPGFEKIERNDIVVFNQPADTLLDMNDFHPDRNYYKPIDKKTNLVKRCVGVPGDSLEVRNGHVFINGKENQLPDRAKLQFFYTVEVNNSFNQGFLDSYNITEYNNVYTLPTKIWENEKIQEYLNENWAFLYEVEKDSLTTSLTGSVPKEVFKRLKFGISSKYFNVNITEDKLDAIQKDSRIKSIEKVPTQRRDVNIFPHDSKYPWNSDFFGPIYIPEKGKTIAINLEVLPLYKRVITEYEGHDLSVKGNQIFIDGQLATTYTFAQDYYWMMGDNRNNSIDARFWGFAPFDHVVGKPVFIWMSWDKNGKGFAKIRWNRLFTTVGGSGKPVSYFIPFLVVLFGSIGFGKWRKRRKAKG